MSRVVAVVPAWNEEAAVGGVVRDLLAPTSFGALSPRSAGDPVRAEVVVVDDGSTDRTGEVARAAGATVLRPPFNLGIGGAVQTGLRYARLTGADAAVQVDGDGQHPADQVARVVAPILAGEADFVIGSRFLSAEGDRTTAARRAGIAWLSGVVRLRCGRTFTDPTSGLRAYGPRALEWLAEDYPEDYPEPQILAPAVRRGLRVLEVPVAMRARETGQSSIRGFGPALYMAKVTLAVLLGSTK